MTIHDCRHAAQRVLEQALRKHALLGGDLMPHFMNPETKTGACLLLTLWIIFDERQHQGRQWSTGRSTGPDCNGFQLISHLNDDEAALMGQVAGQVAGAIEATFEGEAQPQRDGSIIYTLIAHA